MEELFESAFDLACKIKNEQTGELEIAVDVTIKDIEAVLPMRGWSESKVKQYCKKFNNRIHEPNGVCKLAESIIDYAMVDYSRRKYL